MTTAKERREQNRTAHRTQREEALRSRGPRGVASVWWDHARAVAAQHERDGDTAAWERLARALEAFCDTDTPAAVPAGAEGAA